MKTHSCNRSEGSFCIQFRVWTLIRFFCTILEYQYRPIASQSVPASITKIFYTLLMDIYYNKPKQNKINKTEYFYEINCVNVI